MIRKHYTPAQKAAIVLELLKEEDTLPRIASRHGVHPNQLRKWKAQALEGFPKLFTDDEQDKRELESEHQRQMNELYGEIGRLTTQLAWLKKNLASNLTRAERLALLEREQSNLSLRRQCDLLSLNRTSLYYQPLPPSPAELYVKRRIDEIYTECPFYGSRKITALLRLEMDINRKAVQRHMRQMGIAGICPGPNISRRNSEHRVFPYLLRNVTASYPNHVWGIDITYIRLRQGWLYLVVVLDWFSRYVLAWELSDTLDIGFVLTCLQRALTQAKPQICNSDQGSHFTSPQYVDVLLTAEVQISMDGRGRARDNIFTERLWRTVKYEEVYLNEYINPRTAHAGLGRYFPFYNYERPHQSLDYRTPASVYFG